MYVADQKLSTLELYKNYKQTITLVYKEIEASTKIPVFT